MSDDLKDLGFHADQVEPNSFSLIPKGEYVAVAVPGDNENTKATRMPTKNETGELIRLQFQVTEGEFQNRTMLHRFNIKNASAQAQAIGLGQLSEYCRAIGVNSPQNIADLLLKKVRIKVDIKDEYNVIKKFMPYMNGPSMPGVVQPIPAPSNAPGTAALATANPFA